MVGGAGLQGDGVLEQGQRQVKQRPVQRSAGSAVPGAEGLTRRQEAEEQAEARWQREAKPGGNSFMLKGSGSP